jgi:phosphate:Na+ symporter
MDGTTILISILGGVTLLLWGCRMIRTGVMRAFGAGLQKFLGGGSTSRWRSVLAGTVVGVALQSSTAMALLVSPFVSHGAIALSVALAIMLGADLGSAIAAGIFSTGISAAWPILAFGGYVLHATYEGRRIRVQNAGRILLGLGLLFLGLRTIGSAARDLSASPIISAVIEAASSEPLLAVLAGAIMTWAAYSSIAIILLIVALAASAGLAADQLLPLILGVNLGAALPAVSTTISERPAVRRVPLGNLIFRICGVAAALPLLDLAIPFFNDLSDDPGRQIILAHLAFNTALCIVFAGLTAPVAWLTGKIMPDKAGDDVTPGPRHLDAALLQTPSGALGAAARETLRVGDIIEDMLSKTMSVFENDDPILRQAVEAADDDVDVLHEAIKLYLTRLMRDELIDEDSQRAVDIITYAINLEHVGDIIDKNLMELANKKHRLRLQFSEQGLDDIRTMHARVMDTLHLSLNVFMSAGIDSARALIARKTELRKMEMEATEKHLERLRSERPESIMTSAIHVDVIRDFKRINSHLTSVAYPVLERAGELRQTRLMKKSERQIISQTSELRH